MTIKEVEKELNVPRATVRFYEKEKLIFPKRGSNGYRDYSKDDVAKLKKIITLRKLGISVQNIEDIFDGVQKMEDVVTSNMMEIQKKIDELNGAFRLSQVIRERNENIESFDEGYYWNLVIEEEKKGNRFMDIIDDVVKYEKHVFLKQFGLEDAEGGLNTSIEKAMISVFITVVCLGLFSMLMDGKWSVESFKEGALMPLRWIIIFSVVGLPIFFLGKSNQKLASTIKKVLMRIAGVITIGLLILWCLMKFGLVK